MHTLIVQLKQHTPLIHFQHDQDCATLRASEVKPRFDSYLRDKKIVIPPYKMSILSDKKTNTIDPVKIKKGEKTINNAPMFFGDSKKVKLIKSKELTLTITLNEKDKDYKEVISKNIVSFFLSTNFGLRQTKGYGSFIVKSIDGKDVNCSTPSDYISFFESSNDNIFKDIELLHKTLRSGINGPKKESLYFKSLLFTYVDSLRDEESGKPKIWDKKSIKAHFLSVDVKNEVKQIRKKNYNEWSIENDYRGIQLPPSINYSYWKSPNNTDCGSEDYRDYLGLSTSESWMAYDTGSFELKNKKPIIKDGKFVLTKMAIKKSFDKNFKETGRFKSPILYKPILGDDGKWKIYIIINEEPLFKLRNKDIFYQSNMPSTRRFSLKMSSNFSLSDFLHFAFFKGESVVDNFFIDYKKIEDKNKLSSNDKQIYENVQTIYQALNNNLRY